MQAHTNPHHQDSMVKGKEHNMQQLKRKQSKKYVHKCYNLQIFLKGSI